VPQVVLDPERAWQDPASVLSESLELEPAAALRLLAAEEAGADTGSGAGADGDWLGSWQSADRLAAEAIAAELHPAKHAAGRLSEPAVAAELGVLLAQTATLFVASSMPVRDIETFWPARADPPRVLCNRGANGTVSSAFGAAADADGDGEGPVVLLIGDVALAHDLGGLLAARRLGLKLTIVLLDNQGGGIFDFLPVAGAAIGREPDPAAGPRGQRGGEDRAPAATDIYTRHIATPTGLDFAAAASLYGLAHERVADLPALREALERALEREGSSIIEVPGERGGNVELHRRVWGAVSRALSSPAAAGAPPA
jgi:2-succinyl-5-enolpyruvyl-6-hydroxy-3-cyclohexene-1-carboxylate synthase